MSRASRLIRRLDKVLARYDSFGEDPSSFVDSVLASLEDERASLGRKAKQEHWAAIYVERDRARIKLEVLNRVMADGSQSSPAGD